MFGATAVRQKRERERREKMAKGLDQQAFPYIKPYGPRFDRNQLPYFKYRETLHLVKHRTQSRVECGPWEVGVGTLMGLEIR